MSPTYDRRCAHYYLSRLEARGWDKDWLLKLPMARLRRMVKACAYPTTEQPNQTKDTPMKQFNEETIAAMNLMSTNQLVNILVCRGFSYIWASKMPTSYLRKLVVEGYTPLDINSNTPVPPKPIATSTRVAIVTNASGVVLSVTRVNATDIINLNNVKDGHTVTVRNVAEAPTT